jgi:hypothetical protein
MTPWTWRCTGGQDGDRAGSLDGDQVHRKEPYHITHYLYLMLLCESYLCVGI